jgi:hypothetical protein
MLLLLLLPLLESDSFSCRCAQQARWSAAAVLLQWVKF